MQPSRRRRHRRRLTRLVSSRRCYLQCNSHRPELFMRMRFALRGELESSRDRGWVVAQPDIVPQRRRTCFIVKPPGLICRVAKVLVPVVAPVVKARGRYRTFKTTLAGIGNTTVCSSNTNSSTTSTATTSSCRSSVNSVNSGTISSSTVTAVGTAGHGAAAAGDANQNVRVQHVDNAIRGPRGASRNRRHRGGLAWLVRSSCSYVLDPIDDRFPRACRHANLKVLALVVWSPHDLLLNFGHSVQRSTRCGWKPRSLTGRDST